MKLDVEGWERKVLEGATQLLAIKPPKAIVFEGDSDAKGNMQDPEIMKLLEGFGYAVKRVRRPEGVIFHRENYIAKRINPGASMLAGSALKAACTDEFGS
jgi:hypothetical protein